MEFPKRKSIRLKGYDYGQNGAYYVTICTKDKAHLFGEIIAVGADLVSARAQLNYAVQMIEKVFLETVQSFDNIIADKYVVMPNHFHCILVISRAGSVTRAGYVSRADTRSAPTTDTVAMKTVSAVVRAFKSKTTLEYIKGVKSGVLPPFDKQVWQRNYYEHVIRDESDYQTKWKYIDENPAKWVEDEYYCVSDSGSGAGMTWVF